MPAASRGCVEGPERVPAGSAHMPATVAPEICPLRGVALLRALLAVLPLGRKYHPRSRGVAVRGPRAGASAGFAESIRLLVNEAMVPECSAALRAEPYQRSEDRLGHSSGFKDKPLYPRGENHLRRDAGPR